LVLAIQRAEACLKVLNEAVSRYGKPEIFNTQSGQFTSLAFTGALKGRRASLSS
jgi:putative transposase